MPAAAMSSNSKDFINYGAWHVQRERFHLTASRPPAADRSKEVGQVVPSLLKSLGLEDRLWEEQLRIEWPQLVGEQVAHHTRPGRLHRKTLFIFVSNSAWLNELSRYGLKPILEKLQGRFGPDRIQQLRLQLDPDGR